MNKEEKKSPVRLPAIIVPHGVKGQLKVKFRTSYTTVQSSLLGCVGDSYLKRKIREEAIRLGGIIEN